MRGGCALTTKPTDTRASTQGDKGQPFRPQRNVIFERARRMQTPVTRARARVHVPKSGELHTVVDSDRSAGLIGEAG